MEVHLGMFNHLVITVTSAECSVIEETTTQVGFLITVTKPLMVEICVSEESTLVCRKGTIAVTISPTELEVLRVLSLLLGVVQRIIIVPAIWLVVQVTQHSQAGAELVTETPQEHLV